MEKQKNPIPQGKYVPATRSGNLIFTAGMTSRKNGVLILTGRVKADEALETAQAAGGLYPQIIVTVAAGAYGADEKYAATGACLSIMGSFVTIPILMLVLG